MRRRYIKKKKRNREYKRKIIYGKGRFSALNKFIKGGFKFF